MIYLDTSAFLKLVIDDEPWCSDLRTALDDADAPLVSSTLLRVETRRALLRADPRRLPRADLLLDTVNQAEISSTVIESAGRLPGPMLRSPDAIHLATALLLRPDLDGLISYDDRLLEAAAAHSLTITSPGRDGWAAWLSPGPAVPGVPPV